MENKMNKNDVIKLINLYKENPCLWDINSRLYKRHDFKSTAYENISQNMNLPVEVIKKKIKSLRNTYTTEKKKIETSKKSGSGFDELHESCLFYYEEFSFLDGSLVMRKSTNNIDVADNCKEVSVY